MQQNSTNQIQIGVENFRFTLPAPDSYFQRFQNITTEQANEEFQPIAMFILAGMAHQLQIEQAPPSGHQCFKAIYVARETGCDIPLYALESKRGMSKFIAEREAIKREARGEIYQEPDSEQGPVLKYTIAETETLGRDVFKQIRTLLSQWLPK